MERHISGAAILMRRLVTDWPKSIVENTRIIPLSTVLALRSRCADSSANDTGSTWIRRRTARMWDLWCSIALGRRCCLGGNGRPACAALMGHRAKCLRWHDRADIEDVIRIANDPDC